MYPHSILLFSLNSLETMSLQVFLPKFKAFHNERVFSR